MDEIIAGNWTALPISTGPILVTRMLLNEDSVTKYPKEYFYPYLWNEKEEASGSFPDSYAVHRWAHSWRNWEKKYFSAKEEWGKKI